MSATDPRHLVLVRFQRAALVGSLRTPDCYAGVYEQDAVARKIVEPGAAGSAGEGST